MDYRDYNDFEEYNFQDEASDEAVPSSLTRNSIETASDEKLKKLVICLYSLAVKTHEMLLMSPFYSLNKKHNAYLFDENGIFDLVAKILESPNREESLIHSLVFMVGSTPALSVVMSMSPDWFLFWEFGLVSNKESVH